VIGGLSSHRRLLQQPHPAPLPGGLEDLGDRTLQAAVGSAEHQLHAVKTAGLQRAQEVHPENLSFRWADAKADDFPAALGIGGSRDYGNHADNPAALALLEVDGFEPDIGLFANEGAIEELTNPLINVLVQLGHRALRNIA